MTVALVTGAAGTIGGVVVDRLRGAGMAVVAVDVVHSVHHDEAVVSRVVDITDATAVASAVADIEQTVGGVDVLVNAAGVFGDFTRTDRIPIAAWDEYLRTNLSGHFYVTRAVLPSMITRGYGRIVNVASISSTRGGYRQAHYAAAKAGLIGLTRSIAVEYASRGITCNAVLPGPIDTPKVAASAPASVLEDALQWIPADRFGTPGEVAALVAFLTTADAAYVNGASIPVDGAALLLQFRFARKPAAGQARTREGHR